MQPRKVGVVASTEFSSAVRTKAFLISLLLLPLIMVGSILIQTVVARRVDTSPRRFAVLDREGTFYPVIENAARARNTAVVGKDGKPYAPKFEPERVELGDRSRDEALLALSDRVRKGDLFAFVEIPEEVVEPRSAEHEALRYYSENPNDESLADWLEMTVNAEVRGRRLRSAGIDPRLADRLSRPVPTENLGLLSRVAAAPVKPGETTKAGAPATIRQAEKVDRVRSALVPAVLMFVVFMVVMTTTPQLLQSVIEEKMSRISEVLLGSVTPFELMMGKLLGNVGIALVLASLYVGGGYAVANHYGYADAVPASLLAATGFFLVMAIVLFGSLYLAVGSACSELKDAQSLMMPVMLLSMMPIFVWTAVLQSPNSPLSVGMSLFPPATPYLMLLRLSLQPAPPFWQVSLSVVLTLLTVLACVWSAGKIFRVGLLIQGKAPSFAQLIRWVVAK